MVDRTGPDAHSTQRPSAGWYTTMVRSSGAVTAPVPFAADVDALTRWAADLRDRPEVLGVPRQVRRSAAA